MKRVLKEFHEEFQKDKSEFKVKKGRFQPEEDSLRVQGDSRIMRKDEVKNQDRAGGSTDNDVR